MVTYLEKFALNLSEITSPLKNLLAKDALFQWDSAQSKASDMVKDLITSGPSPVFILPNVRSPHYIVMHQSMVLALP